MSYKDRAIQEAERAIDSARKRCQELEEELEAQRAQEQEARAVLQLLKTGTVPSSNGHAKRKTTTPEEYIEAIETVSQEKAYFTAYDVAQLVDAKPDAVKQKLRTLAQQGVLVKTKEGTKYPPTPSEYRYVSAVAGNRN